MLCPIMIWHLHNIKKYSCSLFTDSFDNAWYSSIFIRRTTSTEHTQTESSTPVIRSTLSKSYTFFYQKQCSTTIEKNTKADLIFYQLNLATCCTLLEILISVQVPKCVKEGWTWQKNCNYFNTDEARRDIILESRIFIFQHYVLINLMINILCLYWLNVSCIELDSVPLWPHRNVIVKLAEIL